MKSLDDNSATSSKPRRPGTDVVVFLAAPGVEVERGDPDRPSLFRRIFAFFGLRRKETVADDLQRDTF